METFIQRKNFVEDPDFGLRRERMLSELESAVIDPQIVKLIAGFNSLACCFTLQCCHGHFISADGSEIQSLAPVSVHLRNEEVIYRIAYVAFCIENSASGRILLEQLARVPEIEARYVQFGSAGWFWRRHLNSYVLQVEPERFADADTALLPYPEARFVAEVRDEFFARLREVLKKNAKT